MHAIRTKKKIKLPGLSIFKRHYYFIISLINCLDAVTKKIFYLCPAGFPDNFYQLIAMQLNILSRFIFS